MKLIDVGQEAEGFIAIGQFATGVIAFGQVATGVIAVGQLARGVIVIGQLALGVAAFGQLTCAFTYGGGMLGVAGIRARPSLLVFGLFGEGSLFRGGRLAPRVRRFQSTGWLLAVRLALAGLVTVLVLTVGLSWLTSFDATPDEPPPTTPAPGTR
jgi:hypothetical protein